MEKEKKESILKAGNRLLDAMNNFMAALKVFYDTITIIDSKELEKEVKEDKDLRELNEGLDKELKKIKDFIR